MQIDDPSVTPSTPLVETSLQSAGLVLGTEDSTPLEFWVAVEEGKFLQLDDVVAVERQVPGRPPVKIYGVVTQVRARHEGARFDSDVFLIAKGVLPAEICEAAQVMVTRCEPEIFVPPLPGDRVDKADAEQREAALFFDQMRGKMPIGLSRDNEPVYVSLEFLDGTKAAHVNISGISGVATKTSYACFLLYSLFESNVLGTDAVNSKALIFNVKGEDLLFLDYPNTKLEEEESIRYSKLGLPVGPFQSVGFWAPPRPGDINAVPNVSSRSTNVRSYYWTVYEFCSQDLLQFLFADVDDDRQQYTIVAHSVMAQLRKAEKVGDSGAAKVDGETVTSFEELLDLICRRIETNSPTWAGMAVSTGTINAFIRRMMSAQRQVGHLVRGDLPRPGKHSVDLSNNRVTVVDIHNLNDRAQRFVVGVLLRKTMEEKEQSGASRPLWFVVLDELNKYAPREGSSPIKEVLVDIAERGRSLGIILIGAQQTASEVERRVTGNAALRIVGRLDSAEAGRAEYGFLRGALQARSTILKPGTMIASQPMVPVPLVVEFPFPSWATRADEADQRPRTSTGSLEDPFEAFSVPN